MNTDYWNRVKSEFDEIFELNDSERAEQLTKLKEEDARLYRDVHDLLQNSEVESGLLDEGAMTRAKSLMADESKGESMAGRQVGAYRLIKPIGYGGMGAVYLAERADGSFERNVAVKFIHSGFQHGELLRRFQQEQKIQGSLNHPNIANLYDAGRDAQDTPYLVMEYIEGEDIITYAKRKKLSLDERLQLFVKVCSAVHFAHQNLVIHRDLKPSNIMINQDGECKLLDFGIAKLIDETEDSLTRTNCSFVSFKYAAPEQFKDEHVTTMTDVYALGVILYELLCDELPYEGDLKRLTEIEHAVCEAPVGKPSTKLLKKEKFTGGEVQLAKSLKGDLDNIVLKALSKEPARRYTSANAFREDVERYLENIPVKARPATLAYRSQKFIARNKTGVAAAALIVFLLLFGGIYHTVSVSNERDIAQTEAVKFEKMAGFLVDLFQYDDLVVPPSEATVHNLMEAGFSKLNSEELEELPLVKAELLLVIGRSNLQLGNTSQAYEQIKESVEILESLPYEKSLNLGKAYYYLTTANQIYHQQPNPELVEKALYYTKKEHGYYSNEHANAIWLKAGNTEGDEKNELLDEYYKIVSRIFPKDDPEYGRTFFEYTNYRYELTENEYEKLLEALEVNKNIVGREHPTIANIYNSLGYAIRLSDPEKSIGYFEESRDIYMSLYGTGHYRTINTLTNLASVYRRAGDGEKAGETHRQAYEAALTVYRPGSIRVADHQFWLADHFIRTREFDKAEKHFRDVLYVFSQNYEPGSEKVELARMQLGTVLSASGNETEGREMLEQTLNNVLNFYGEEHYLVGMVRSRLQ